MVGLDLPMPVRTVRAHEKVETDRDRIAIERGPIVYCIEAVDHGGAVRDIWLDDGVDLSARPLADLYRLGYRLNELEATRQDRSNLNIVDGDRAMVSQDQLEVCILTDDERLRYNPINRKVARLTAQETAVRWNWSVGADVNTHLGARRRNDVALGIDADFSIRCP